jgi:uroporphyrin-III C-methyltransferase
LERPAGGPEPIGASRAPCFGAGGWWSHLGAGVAAGVRARAAVSGGSVGSTPAVAPASTPSADPQPAGAAAAGAARSPAAASAAAGSAGSPAAALPSTARPATSPVAVASVSAAAGSTGSPAATLPPTAGVSGGAPAHLATSPHAVPSSAEAAPAGVVTLVGAGPGDPDLLTLGAARAIAEADLVLCDRLVPPAIRALARGEVRVANKEPGLADAVQHELDDAAIAAARAGFRVVRLKIGDPGVFGRLGEELDSYAAAEVPSRVVPGVSSALAGPALAGVPLTLRGVADQIVIGTGHAAGDADVDAPAWRPGTTWVFLMAVRRLDALASGCVAAGFPADLPAALIQDASTPAQRVVDSTLATLAVDARRHGVRAPAVLVLGEVAALRHRAVQAAPLRATG